MALRDPTFAAIAHIDYAVATVSNNTHRQSAREDPRLVLQGHRLTRSLPPRMQWLFLMSAGDLLLTASLVFFLNGAKQDQDATNSVLDRIIANTIRNNGTTALTAVLSAALFVWGVGAWHVIAGLVISKLYQVSFMSSLNARVGLAEELRMRRATHPGATPSPLPPAVRLDARSGSRRRRAGSAKSGERNPDLEQGQRRTSSTGHLGLHSLHALSFGVGSLTRPKLDRGRSGDG